MPLRLEALVSSGLRVGGRRLFKSLTVGLASFIFINFTEIKQSRRSEVNYSLELLSQVSILDCFLQENWIVSRRGTGRAEEAVELVLKHLTELLILFFALFDYGFLYSMGLKVL
jgi:hypothetical protein